MFRTKKEVDRHAADLLRRTRDDKERNGKGYQIAKLYQQVGEYEIARRYLTAFLTVQDAVPQAHKLMGQICESLKDYRRAIVSYEKCLKLNENQKDVILKVCELLLRIKVDKETVKYWIEKAESVVQGSEVVFHLKEKLIDSESDGNPTELENFFKSELVKKPGNVHIRIKLLKLYVDSKRIDTAIGHAVSVDSLYIFDFNVEWYDYLVEFYSIPYVCSHMEHHPTDINVYTHKVFAHCKQLLLWMPAKDVSDITEALHAFDQLLLNVASLQFHQPQWTAFLSEMQGYFFFFCGCLLFKRSLKGQSTWKEIEGAATLCYLASVSYRPIDKHSDLYLQGDLTNRLFVKYLHKMGCYRLSQVGHVLCDIVKKHSSNWIYDLTVRCCTPQCKEQLYDLVFTFRDMRRGRGKSFLLSENAFNNVTSTIPTKSDLAECDQVSVLLNSTDLNSIIWLCLHYYNASKDDAQPNYNFSLFDNLPYSSSSLSSGLNLGVESLCQLDTEVFLIAVVYSAGRLLQQVRQEPSRPQLLPKVLCRQFCTPEQAEWWQLACKFREKLELDNFTKLRLILMRGLDTVRLTEGHGMSASLILHVARTLQNKASQLKAELENGHGSFNKLENIEERAAYYWQAALPLLQRLQKNLVLKMPKVRLFPDDSDNELDADCIKDLIGDCEYHLALSFMSKGDHEEAIKRFESLSNPWASYHTAQVYRKLASNEQTTTRQPDDVSQDNHQSRYIALLTKAKEALYITLDRLKGNKTHQLNQVIYGEIDDIEFNLTRLAINNGPFPLIDDASSTESFCSANMNISTGIPAFDSPPHEIHIRSSSPIQCRDNSLNDSERKKSPSNKKQTPKSHRNSSESSHVRPSPERLDAQLRALQLSHISILKPMVDQNKELTKFNVSLQQQLRECKELNQLYLTELTQYRMMAGTFHPTTPAVPSPTPPAPHSLVAAAYMNNHSPYAAHPPPAPPPLAFTPSPVPTSLLASHFTGYQFHTQLPPNPHQHPHMPQTPYGMTTPVAASVSPKAMPGDRMSATAPYSKVVKMMTSITSPMVTPSTSVFNSTTLSTAVTSASGSSAAATVSTTIAASSPVRTRAVDACGSSGLMDVSEGVAPSSCEDIVNEEEEVAEEECNEDDEDEDEEDEEEDDDEDEEEEEDDEEDPCHVDGEYYDESKSNLSSSPPSLPIAAGSTALNSPMMGTTTRLHIPDSQLVQDYPFGHKTSLVGKSTVAYLPQQLGGPLHHHPHHHHQPPQLQQHCSPAPALPRPGYFADALRGHSHQYNYQNISPGSNTATNLNASPCGSGTSLTGTPEFGVSPAGLGLGLAFGSSPTTAVLSRMSSPSSGFFSADATNSSGNMAAGTPKGVASMGMVFPSPHPSPATPMANLSPLQSADQSTGATSITSGQPPSSALLKVLNNNHQQQQPAEGMKYPSSSSSWGVGLTLNTPEASKGPSQTFGGFTFSCTPKVDFDAANKTSQPGQKTLATMTTSTATTTTTTSSTSSTQKPFWNFSFLDASKPSTPLFPNKVDTTPAGDATPPTTKTLFGSTTPSNIFSSSPSFLSSNLFSSSKADTSNKEDEVEEYEPNVNFAPVVPLPELVDLKTGEEEEEKLFGDRAKLYRFDKETNQWKERGVGELKILHNKFTNRCRMLMRREQVLKLCANHFLSADMKLTPMSSSTKAWCWNAQDFAEEELKVEKFAARFKLPEIAEEFKLAFEKAQQYCALHAANSGKKNTPVKDNADKKDTVISPAASTGTVKPLSELFKPEEGSWECPQCCIINNKDAACCIACQSNNPKSKAVSPAKGHTVLPPTSSDKPPLSELFKGQAGTWECSSCYLMVNEDELECLACQTPKPGVEKEDLKTWKSATAPTSSISSSFITSTGFKFVPDNSGSSIGKDGFKFSPEFTLGSVSKAPSITVPSLSTAITTTAVTTTMTTTSAVSALFSLNTCSPQSSFTTTTANHPFVFSSAETSSVFGNKSTGPKTELPAEKSNVPLFELFKSQPGQWECPTCCLCCQATQVKCAACGTSKPNSTGVQGVNSVSGPGQTGTVSGFPINKNCNFVFGASSFGSPTFRSTNFDATKTPGLKPTPNWSSPRMASLGSMSLISNGPGMATTTITTTTTIYTTPSFSFGANTPASQNSKPPAFNLSQPKFNFSLTSNTSGKGILGPGPSNAALTNVTAGGAATPSTQAAPVTQATTPFFSFSMTPSQPGVLTSLADSSKGLSPNLGVAKSPDSADDGYYVNRDGEDSHIKFDPIMPLPDKVEVRTGEEDEHCLFEHRAKLYRFGSSEWKERGLGNIKILENTQTQKLRLVMRREQVLKVCCNHYITADVDLKPKVNSKGCAWVWCAFDSSDGGEAQLQHLSIRFKTAEIANNFKEAFEEAKQKAIAYQKSADKNKENSTDHSTLTISPAVKGPKSEVKRSSVATTLFPDPDYKNLGDSDEAQEKEFTDEDEVIFIKRVEATPEQVKRARELMLPDHFYLYESKEPCPGCRGCHPEDVKKSPKQTYAAKAALPVSDQHKIQSLQSPTSSTGTDTPVTPETTTTTNITATTTTTTTFPADSSNSNMPFSRLMNNTEYSGMLFSTLAAQANTQETTAFQKDKSKPFSWQGAGQKLFDVKSSPSAANNDDDDDDDVVGNVDIHFDPVIELPALIDRKSGEEDETPLFVQRSKLYRFDKTLNCWKEKGIGNMKILSHNGSVRFRLLFRREQVLKVACNHLLTTNLVLKRMSTSETSWCWVARDYTDEKEGTVEQFAVRFKTVELASTFQKCFVECQEKLRQEESQLAGSGMASTDIQGLSNTLSTLNVELKDTLAEGSRETQAAEKSEEEKEDKEAEEVDVRFEKRATLYYKVDKEWVSLGLGNLQVEYDTTIGGLRIVMTDSSDKQLCNHIITREANFTQCASKHKHSGTWASMDEVSAETGQRTFRLDFSSAAAYTEFKDVFQQGKMMAKELNLSEHSIYST